MQIFTVGALAGAAKTYSRCATAGVRAGEKYIVCVPPGHRTPLVGVLLRKRLLVN
jgi:hypothetical protein